MEDMLIRIGYIEGESNYTVNDGYIEIYNIRLEIFQTDKTLNYLMQTLKKIELSKSTIYLINYLPSYITHLSLVDPGNQLTYDNLHNGLISLYIQTEVIFNKSLDNLPQTLETLFISSRANIETSLTFLPVSLKIFGIRSRNKCNLDNLPSNLETLFITGCMNIQDKYNMDDLANLPENLITFKCTPSCISSLDNWNDIQRKLSARYPNLNIEID